MRPREVTGIRRGRAEGIPCAARLVALFLCATNGFAASTNATDEIPPLRPPIRQIPPGTWELYGPWILLAAGCFVLVLTGLVVWLTRSRPAAPVPPAQTARLALGSLQRQSQDPLYLTSVTRILRKYLTSVFNLPREEFTTAEFQRALIECKRAKAEVATAAVRFLQKCDQEKFSPRSGALSWNAAEEALQIVDAVEASLLAASPQPA